MIQQAIRVRESLHFLSEESQMITTSTYSGALYGSQTWDLSSKEANSVFSSWRQATKDIYQVPNNTHKWVVE